ncbi:MAG: RlmI/RlmK family 23S rRNA methyltransferase, partial [Planctomycetes bacterium]|nr:RlmI/RlmK family 23S rRNA methyltransferase [Planctomycetota bacterium]
MTTVRLTTAATKLARKGHPWFFSDDLATDAPQGDAKIVRLAGHRGEDLGLAFYSAASRLRVRRCGGWPGAAVPGPEEFFRERLTEACAQRAEQRAPEPRGVRLVHGDADGLPGLVVDRYADCLVLQSSAAVIERHLSCIVPWLREHTGAVSVLARNDLPTRRREGMPEEVRLLDGKRVEEVVIEELGIRHRVRPFAGHKTGFYLDQR